MAGKTIGPATALPPLTDPQTTIEGDLDGDGTPNIGLRGPASGTTFEGLRVTGDECIISGLAPYRFTDECHVRLEGAYGCTIRRCWFGLSPTGTRYDQGANSYLKIGGGGRHLVGGPSWLDRNVFHTVPAGMSIEDSSNNTVIGNYFGVTPDGSGKLKSNGQTGLSISSSSPSVGSTNNTIGGPGSEGNVFAGSIRGISLNNAGTDYNQILGNYFGLAADGSTFLLTPQGGGIEVFSGPAYNTIGDTTARNVFAGDASGICMASPGAGNRIQCNYFGTNAAGTKQLRLPCGVNVYGPSGSQTIGGATASLANYFCGWAPSGKEAVGVWLSEGAGTTISHNKFGILPGGGKMPRGLNAGVRINGIAAEVTNNTIRKCGSGVECTGAGANPTVRGNNIGGAMGAVLIHNGATCFLGDMALGQPGNNNLRPTSGYYVCNETPNDIKAEGNSFGTTSEAAILAKMWDHHIDPGLGTVDFDPLKGGIHPTGLHGLLSLTAAVAAPTAAGAEIAFALSSPATVTIEVLNVAGRVVAVERAGDLPAGHQRVAWDGRGSGGVPVPTGRYLIRITARDAGGARATALAPMSLTR
jgi:hypothetical protein